MSSENGIERFHEKGGVIKGTTTITTGGETASGANAWVAAKDARHKANADKWEFIEHQYNGECVDEPQVREYVPQKMSAEPEEDYRDRLLMLNPPTEFPFLVDSFSGMIEAGDRNTKLELAPPDSDEGFGDVDNPESLGAKLLSNVDGNGTNWQPFWSQFDNRIIRYFEMWVLVEGIIKDPDTGETVKDPHVRLIDPIDVTNTLTRNGKHEAVVVQHMADARKSIRDAHGTVKRWTVYTLDGWELYEEVSSKKQKRDIALVDAGTYAYYDSKDRTRSRRVLPIFKVRLPMDRFVSYQAARRQNSILNKESERDAAVRNGNIARLAIVGSTGFYESIMEAADKGYKIIRHDPENSTQHYYITPPEGPPRLASDIIEKERENFFVTNFRDYANAAREKTATEIKSDHRAGKEAFLYLVATAKTEAQNRALFLLEQANFPEKPALWGVAYVNREPDFSLVTGKDIVDTILEKVIGDRKIPTGRTGMRSAVLTVLDYFGLEYDELEVQAAVDSMIASEAQEGAALSQFGL